METGHLVATISLEGQAPLAAGWLQFMGELAILQWQDLTQSGEPDQIQVCNARTFEVLSTHKYIARGDGETDVVVVGGKLIKVARVDEEGNHSESIVTSWSSSSRRAPESSRLAPDRAPDICS